MSLHWLPMTAAELDAVVAVEQTAYSHPWTRGQFNDSLASGHDAWLLYADDELIGYHVTMPVLDEVHLLNITVAPAHQGQGHGGTLLRHMLEVARLADAASVWLEARQSNTRALRLYARHGFERVGQRRDYYPIGHGQRETALVLRRVLGPDDHALG